jgi:hypothetical protein
MKTRSTVPELLYADRRVDRHGEPSGRTFLILLVNEHKICGHTRLFRPEFESAIPVFERYVTVFVLDSPVTIIVSIL